jgi:hypothetical protein
MSESRRGLEAPTADEVGKLLRLASVPRRSGGTGTLMTEPLVLVHGIHREASQLLFEQKAVQRIGEERTFAVTRRRHNADYELFDQDARWLGSVVAAHPAPRYEFRDPDARCVLALRKLAVSAKRVRLVGLWKWQYEIVLPGAGVTISVKQVARKSDPAEVTQGSQQIGSIQEILKPAAQTRFARVAAMLRLGVSPAFVIHDNAGRETARVHIAERRGNLVDLVAEIQQGTPERLRKVALGASVIAANELLNWSGA